MKTGPKCIVSAAVLICLGGCQTIYEGKYDWEAGWRPGTVVKVGYSDQLTKEPFRDCRSKLNVEEQRSSQFAVISYPFLSRPRNAIVPISTQSGWMRGNLVYLNVLDCKAALQPRGSGV